MRCYIPLIFFFLLTGCVSDFVHKDKRQITAKDVMETWLPRRSKDYDISAFREDTIARKDSLFKKVLQYTLFYQFTDSTGRLQKRRGIVLFTPDGKSVISSFPSVNP
jgi:hypothetical protein